jgi:tripartite-type tricarboxylate transporter receptor subunit TctC
VKAWARVFVCCALLALVGEATAQTWPNRPLKLVVPTGAGSATDVMARLLAEGISSGLGQPVVVENMPAASGVVAHQAVARAEPDGHTLLFTNTSGMAVNLVSFKQLPYDPTRDFLPVAMVCSLGPQMLSINAEVPAQTIQEFLSYARTNRGKLSMGFDNTAGAAAFAAKLFNRRADLGLVEVPYRAGPQAAQDAASGVTQVLMSSIAAANALVQAGKLRRLAVTSTSRFPGLPDLPSMKEHVPGVVMNGWFAVVAPAATPAFVIERVNRQIDLFLKGDEIKQKLLSFGLATEGAGTPETTAKYIRDEQNAWRALAKELDIQPQ